MSDEQRAILTELAESPMFGLDLHQATGLNPGKLYPNLIVLRQAKLIVSEWVDHGPGIPPRMLYAITEAGREALK